MDIFSGIKKLGFGLMRLPLTNPNDESSIDIDHFKKMVDLFLSRGFTYFDTAIMYCGSKSQNATKEALTDRYPRDKFQLATKLHAGFFNSMEGRDKIFNNQLDSTGVDFFDYYLLHDAGADNYKKYVDFDCFNWLVEKKKQGLVKHIGFSYHDSAELLDKILNKHPEVEFVQLQLNYFDWKSATVQSEKCYEVCVKHNKPVIVMEPVRGGLLAEMTGEVKDIFKSYNPDMSVASWAIRFAASHDNVKVVLSGMSNLEQMLDNTSYMMDFKPLNDGEKKVLNKALDKIRENLTVSCTGCSYCTEGCPKKIAIPKYFALLNANRIKEVNADWNLQKAYYERLIQVFGKASECIGCGKCEDICPQHLEIRKWLKLVVKDFES